MILSVLQVICLRRQRSDHGHDNYEAQAGRQDEDGARGKIHGAKDVSNQAHHQALTFYAPRIS